MVYPIYIYGSSVLREEAAEVERDYPELKKLVQDMFETMYASSGVGLAAPQIGKPLRMFVVDARMYADEEPELADFKRVFINPEIYGESEEEVVMNEGCLSLPGLNEDVQRPEAIRIRWFDEDFKEHDELIEGYAARVVQHEYDHLEGTVFTDHLSPLRKTLIRAKLSAMSKGKVSAKYKTRLVK
ncbi:MAG: peptide deformylase [Rikenellaceae bacterium]|nr:peptide deformylase [Rikenellaceae bacterium]